MEGPHDILWKRDDHKATNSITETLGAFGPCPFWTFTDEVLSQFFRYTVEQSDGMTSQIQCTGLPFLVTSLCHTCYACLVFIRTMVRVVGKFVSHMGPSCQLTDELATGLQAESHRFVASSFKVIPVKPP